MTLVRWTRFSWDLAKLPASGEVSIDSRYTIRPAARDEEKTVHDVIFSAFSLDMDWADTLKSMSDWLETQIDETFSNRGVPAFVVTHGVRIIGASLLDPDHAADNHLLTGPCILNEYSNRGIGTALLYSSLCALRESGLEQGHGVTKTNVPAGKFVYPKFGSVSEPFDFMPQLVGS